MKLEQIIEKLHGLVKQLKSDYISKLENTAKELLADLESGKGGIEDIRNLTKEAVEEFQADLEKVLSDLERKIEDTTSAVDSDLDSAHAEAEKEIQNGFGKVFERIYAKLKGLFRG
ncbi:MAG: hypothetical protein CMP57_02040 [Flavobacteriales bacterium]|nr:hypothetical protein [Flavobacteriales bacterium]|tara:strand:- start:41 stop:388 length:348 start_codon:yes stop_codon:yes gene_type:complete